MRSAFYSLVNFLNTTSIHDVYFKAAKTILLNIYKIPDCTITEVADMCYVSTATISRLCRKLNYESFADFKKDVINNLNYFNKDWQRFIFDHQIPERKDLSQGKEVFHDHFENIIHNLRDTYESVAYNDLLRIVDKIHDARRICFMGNFFTQTAAMQLQIELAYLGKECLAMYPLAQQQEVLNELNKDDLIIISSIAGSFFDIHPDIMRAVSKTDCYKVCISQVDEFAYSDCIDLILKVGNDHQSLIGKFSIMYIYEVLEALYHIKYGK